MVRIVDEPVEVPSPVREVLGLLDVVRALLLVSDLQDVAGDRGGDRPVPAAGDVDPGRELSRLRERRRRRVPCLVDVLDGERPVGLGTLRRDHAGTAPVPALVEVLPKVRAVGVRPRTGLVETGPLLIVPGFPVVDYRVE